MQHHHVNVWRVRYEYPETRWHEVFFSSRELIVRSIRLTYSEIANGIVDDGSIIIVNIAAGKHVFSVDNIVDAPVLDEPDHL